MGSLLESSTKMKKLWRLILILPMFYVLAYCDKCLNCENVSDRKREFRSISQDDTLIKNGRSMKLKSEKFNSILDRYPSGQYQTHSWRNVKLPMPIVLNERFRNPKFISKHPKRNRVNQIIKPINSIVKSPRNKQKNRSKTKVFNHANILNTNFRFAYLARIKSKSKAVTQRNLQSVQSDLQILDKIIRSARPLDVRRGLSKGRRTRVLRRKIKSQL